MKNITIDIQPTTRPTIVKFEANVFLTKHENFEFNNIEEAGRSPLAQQLFHLPFVKKVYIAQNFVAIEKYNIVHWKDVQQEISEQIETYLNNGGTAVTPPQEEIKKVPVTIYAESTPNPTVMKFVSNKKLVLQSVEFKNIDEAKNAPLAKALFHFPFVKEVFIDENYLSIMKYDIAEWEEITQELREYMREYLEQGKEVLIEDSEQPSAVKSEGKAPIKKVELDDTSKEIVAILDEYIKPAVASDGGNILFDSYDEQQKLVKVILQGACSGCPSSTMTLKNGIETMLKDILQGRVDRVEAING
ncbi:NifU family protein [Salinimicrobium sp. MT39]|uniref:NifU family protein n=1 Tax=Salinimicrobium profundisediminis TaxID=2994553 RepID=A0A9X3CUU9_9FLAO|nr:NifU family protein [Salinimicrobium profundisediminis]MCX2837222.1 NifU family protein [Salinimicrobium profundisediminis]